MHNNPPAHIKGLIFDLDGVIWKRNQLIPGSREAIEKLVKSGKQVAFLSNNSSASRNQFVQKLCGFGIETPPERVITSAHVCAGYIRNKNPQACVLVVGMPGLQQEMEDAGLTVTSEPERADFVVAGYDSTLNYQKLTMALRALLAGAKFIATNDDGILPTELGYYPGAGATVGAVKGMIKRDPDLLVGKPNDLTIRIALENMKLKIEECAFIGDSLNTDILLANKLRMYSVLVMTGNTRSLKEVEDSLYQPDCILSSIAEVPDLFEDTREEII